MTTEKIRIIIQDTIDRLVEAKTSDVGRIILSQEIRNLRKALAELSEAQVEKAKKILTDGIEKADWPESGIMKDALAELDKPNPPIAVDLPDEILVAGSGKVLSKEEVMKRTKLEPTELELLKENRSLRKTNLSFAPNQIRQEKLIKEQQTEIDRLNSELSTKDSELNTQAERIEELGNLLKGIKPHLKDMNMIADIEMAFEPAPIRGYCRYIPANDPRNRHRPLEKDIPLPSTDYLRVQADFCKEHIGIDDFMRSIAYDLKRAANEIDRLTSENKQLKADRDCGCHTHTIDTAVDEDGCCVSCGEDLNFIAQQGERIKELGETIDRLTTENRSLKSDVGRQNKL